MASNLHIDQNLLEQAKNLGNHRFKTDALNAALKQYVQHHQQQKILDLFGSIEFDESFDYKKARKRK